MTAIRIPQVKPWLGAEEEAAVAQCVRDNWLTEGPRCAEFKTKLLELIGAPYGVFAPNGTLALALGLMALGIGPGDEVIVPDITFIGSANAVLLTGARPVFVDVEPVNFHIDVERVEAAVTPRTKAIMPVHLFGTACDVDALSDAFPKIFLIEDACQGIGVRIDDVHVGSLGDVGCFSFFADKTITTGEGGFVVTHDRAIYERLLLLRNQGRPNSGTFIHEAVGYNLRITDMQAAIGLCQIAKLPEIIYRKLSIYDQYCMTLNKLDEVRVLDKAPNANLVPFRLVLMCDDPVGLGGYLRTAGIEPRRFFHPMHQQPCFTSLLLEMKDEDFPVSIKAAERGICLPIYPTMTRAEVACVVENVALFYA